jgi:hypothetical protein
MANAGRDRFDLMRQIRNLHLLFAPEHRSVAFENSDRRAEMGALHEKQLKMDAGDFRFWISKAAPWQRGQIEIARLLPLVLKAGAMQLRAAVWGAVVLLSASFRNSSKASYFTSMFIDIGGPQRRSALIFDAKIIP